MMEIIETIKQILAIGGLICFALIVAIVLVILLACLIAVIKTVGGSR